MGAGCCDPAGRWSGAPARHPPEYEFTLIEAFDVNYDLREVILRDINESGLVIGTATHNGFYDGFVWDQVNDKNIVPLLWPMGMNNLNQIVTDGKIYDYDTGAVTNVPPAGGYPVPRLMAINDVGTAVVLRMAAATATHHSDRSSLGFVEWKPHDSRRQQRERALRVTNAAGGYSWRVGGSNFALTS
jgi:hypothetical protein